MAVAADAQQDELKKKLVRRIGIAGVLIVVLLGGLALLEDALVEKPALAPAPDPAAAPAAPAEPTRAEAPPAGEKQEEAKPEAPKEEPKAEPEKTGMPLAPGPEPKPAPRVVIRPPAPAPASPRQVAPVKAEQAVPPATAAKPDLAAVARGYRLQMGVFTNAANAEELHAKLEQAGIPSYIESRVHVGPFRTQREADEARRKLKALGLGAGLLIPPQRR